MSDDPILAKEVGAVLKSRASSQEKPSDSDLLPVYRYLVPSSTASSSSSTSKVDKETHWYCKKAKSALHKESATYLIFLFAFQRQGTSKAWVDRLEEVLLSCEGCARAFGGARRKLGSKYLSKWPSQVRVNFFAAVDKWQSTLILNQIKEASKTAYGTTSFSSTPELYTLTRPMLQLLLSEPSLIDPEKGLNSAELSSSLDKAIASSAVTSAITSSGVSTLLVHLLSSPIEVRRKWAISQLASSSRRSLPFDEWCSLGIGQEIQSLYSDDVQIDGKDRWVAVSAILTAGVLNTETVEKGLLGGQLEEDPKGRKNRGLMSALSALLGSDVPYFPEVLSCFSTLLNICPNQHIWSFDTSPDRPHTLFSEIRSNPAFQYLIETRYQDSPADMNAILPEWSEKLDKGKGKSSESSESLDWIRNFLVSLVDLEKGDIVITDGKKTSGFSEALALAMNFTFQEMQHTRLAGSLRAAAATAGFESLIAVHQAISSEDVTMVITLNSTLDLHAHFITTVALRHKDYPLPIWSQARSRASDLLVTFFSADGESTVQSVLAMATMSHAEKKRLQRKKRNKGDVAAAVRVERLPHACINKELWNMAYEALSPSDVVGAAIIIRSMAPFSHLEVIDRQNSWKYEGLEEVVKKEEWVDTIRSVNSTIKGSREAFPRAIESLAMGLDPEYVKSLWNQPGVPKAVTMLLLSPDDEVHTPIITLIQQTYEDVDDRADCFRALLQNHPDMTMDGLTEFLRTFIQTATYTPESCSLAKWLVRCFHDVLEALCTGSASSEALLQTTQFLTSFADGKGMAKRIEELWHLMTTSLALIFKRTLDWAPLFENEVMVDWMRDALIFGRQMTDHIRAFEGAVLGQSGNRSFEDVLESPVKVTSVGKKMARQLEMVLTDLILWLRLTDVETLFQTHQLIKTILDRISRSVPDLSKNPVLERTLQEIDKFCRKSSKSYTSRLTDDRLSELSELLIGFNLTDQDEIQFVKQVSGTSTHEPERIKSKPTVRNAFEEMMKASGKTPPAKEKAKPSGPPPKVIDVDDFDDDFLDNLSSTDLDIIEKRAKITAKDGKPTTAVKPRLPGQLSTSARPQIPSNKIHVDLTHRAVPKTTSAFTSKFMREMKSQHNQERKREIGGIVPKLPAPSALGSGLGVYTGPRAKTVQPVDSGSSASESSDDEKGAMSNLVAKQKPLPQIKPVEKRSIKIIGSDTSDMLRRNEEKRAKAHATKMRLKPDLNPLYRYVLSWNPDHKGSTAPHGEKYAPTLSNMRNVPTAFGSALQYEQVMLPLYLQELWSQCIKEDNVSMKGTVQVEVSSRQYEDDFIEIDLTVAGPAGDFFANETDVVILRQPGNSNAIFAKVQAYKRKPKEIAIKVRIMASMDQRELSGRSKWQLKKHLSLSTAIREFAALKGLPYYESALLQDALAGRSAPMPGLALDDIEDAMKSYDVNEPQAKAILGATHVKGFALIQGPPGTGKTKTISGLVGKWMSERRTPMSVDGRPPPKPKLLVCAPSNAAIDEVCKRLILGVPSSSGIRLSPTIVRIGIDSSVNIAVKDVSLDSLVEARVNAETNGKDGGSEYARLQSELDSVKQQIKDKQEQLRLVQNHEEKRKVVENDYHALVTRRTQLGQAASRAKDAARDATRHLDGARRAAKEQILNEADIICATLSGAGQDTLAAHIFETVIIDEAAQAIEMSCLIPLKYGCKRCIMVGDPNQLPPTTFSVEADRYHYNESLFVRMTKNKASQVSLLSIQYRMHPFISELPSKVFYNGQLKDGPDMARKTTAVWHQRNVFGPYRFFNVNGHEEKAGTSTKNTAEALAAVDLYKRLNMDYGMKINLSMRIGVISMYKEQLWELRRRFTEAFGGTILETIDFNTVDGFQGQEKDIIILSCVRSGPNLRTIGFLKDARRMNVALTRAKSSLFVFGNGPTLERSDERWKTIVGDARERGFLIDYTSSTFGPEALDPPPPKKKKKERLSNGDSKSHSIAAPASPDSLLPPKALAAEINTIKRKASVDAIGDEKKRIVPNGPGPDADYKNFSPIDPKSTKPIAVPVPKTNGVANGDHDNQIVPRPRTTTTEASINPQSRPHAPKGPAPPPPPPQRTAEDALFIKKKKVSQRTMFIGP
uniref:Senataxin n=1 Tax=Kwoniella pini CBS 10737 TaxID=1296096 RepID=A0A1B9I6P8_9TREE|nr:senataxin [Kwoniella pini CBS 10737]OCF51200.1 senataxin [Kwoniella pini CBS 10737]